MTAHHDAHLRRLWAAERDADAIMHEIAGRKELAALDRQVAEKLRSEADAILGLHGRDLLDSATHHRSGVRGLRERERAERRAAREMA